MITVRFPTGVSVTYNTANEINRTASGNVELCRRDAEQKLWLIALVPAGTDCVIEHTAPCKFENPIECATVDAAIRMLTRDGKAIRSAPSYFVKKLKLMLTEFNGKTHQWRDQ
jgi:hypothetical protein